MLIFTGSETGCFGVGVQLLMMTAMIIKTIKVRITG